MINFNGTVTNNTTTIAYNNRGFAYGDALFETLRVVHGKILFLEAHYFRLMASMRILRMEIPMNFTMEFFGEEIMKAITANKLSETSARVKVTVYRGEGGLYLPTSKTVGYVVSATPLASDFYLLDDSTPYEVDLFKDYYLSPDLLSTLKTTSKAINVIGSIYANENDLDNCLLINTDKHVVEALNGNLFLVKGNTIKTPPISDGCLNGVLRKQLLEVIKLLPDYTLTEASVSPFELQRMDEMFITNVITGIQPITKYRKKTYTVNVAKQLLQKLNVKVRLAN
ncbi:MAG: aminotransferase class IV [Algicola sp.]|nr:aminotransferase class IV [Algicola sp.]